MVFPVKISAGKYLEFNPADLLPNSVLWSCVCLSHTGEGGGDFTLKP